MKKLIFVLMVLALSVSALATHLFSPEIEAMKEGLRGHTFVSTGVYKTPLDFNRRYGVERVTHYDPRVNWPNIEATVYLGPVEPEEFKGTGRGGMSPMYARGTARIQSSTFYGFPRSEVRVNTKDIPPSYEVNGMFEGWMVDADTGYRMSMGTFTTGFGGVGESVYRINKYLEPYDYVEITLEPYDDMDVSPGPVVLIGTLPDLTELKYYNPPPKQSKMITQSIKNY